MRLGDSFALGEEMDDGSGVLIPLMTRTQMNLRMHHNMGLEAAAAIQQAAHAFGVAMNQAAAGVDMLAPESIQFRQAYNDLEAEFSAFMDKVPLSNPMGLQALAEEAPRFALKAGNLPAVRKKAPRRHNKVPGATDQLKTKLEAPPMDPAPQAEPQIG